MGGSGKGEKQARRGKRLGNMPVQSEKERVQGVRRGEHLPVQPDKEQVQAECKTCKADKDDSMSPDLKKHEI